MSASSGVDDIRTNTSQSRRSYSSRHYGEASSNSKETLYSGVWLFTLVGMFWDCFCLLQGEDSAMGYLFFMHGYEISNFLSSSSLQTGVVQHLNTIVRDWRYVIDDSIWVQSVLVIDATMVMV
ncbi:hypothetical protein MRB53_007113 [Persea americana]|uniref:Uncharacterized protein n=1 Tax=Persea americana TaxID=3435 RepID=A0ACC2MJ03_PERAE|nr:hypothetical protein MRB53_007113 [Persea americana]